MGSGKPGCSSGAGASVPPQPQPLCAAVCCMCGDRGLLPELFRCAACSVRSQHTYCTDRYPKSETYGTCNWCLRAGQGNNAAGAGAGAASRSARPTTASHGQDPITGRSGPAKQVAARGDFAAGLSKPIKKPPPTPTTPQQRRLLLRRSASDLGISRVRGGAGHDAPPSPGAARGRPRVRRYKLLEEVITR